jgi:hypothetical protein
MRLVPVEVTDGHSRILWDSYDIFAGHLPRRDKVVLIIADRVDT